MHCQSAPLTLSWHWAHVVTHSDRTLVLCVQQMKRDLLKKRWQPAPIAVQTLSDKEVLLQKQQRVASSKFSNVITRHDHKVGRPCLCALHACYAVCVASSGAGAVTCHTMCTRLVAWCGMVW